MIGKTISHYRVLSKLGEGGMGVVYKAEDTKLQRFVALKFLPPGLADETTKIRFIHEARAASALEHPNICAMYEIDETAEGRLFIVMPCYEGESLEARIARGPLPIEEALEIARQVASGLARAHEKGIIHRDIKPANLFLTQDGPKIVDFGLAKLARQTKLTRTGTTVGTVRYMSPEQARGEETDHRSDLWSLGVVLYEMVAGKLPFKGDHEPALLYSITNQDPELVSALRMDAPPELDDLVERMLAKKPAERMQSADEVVTELTALKEELSVTTGTGKRRRSKAAQRRARKRWAIRLGIPATVGILVLAYFLLRPVFFQDIAVSTPAPIAVVAFENQTGDPSLDYLQDAIPNLLITSLEQSSYLQVATWERLRDLLKQMGKENIREIDEETASELCQRGGYCAIVRGSFTKAGDVFVTNVKVIDAQTKQSIGSAKTDGQGPESILTSQIDELSKEIAKTTGLSERKLEQTTRPIAEVTTTSLEAYNYFLRGRDEYQKYYFEDARKFLEKAVELDSTFAVAHLYLGRTYVRLNWVTLGNLEYRKAMSLSQKVPEKERLFIQQVYALSIEMDRDKSARILTELVEKYPNEKAARIHLSSYFRSKHALADAERECNKALDLDPHYGPALNELAYIFLTKKEYEKALQYLEQYAAASPGDVNPLDSMGDVYFRMGQLDKAIAKYKEAIEVRADVSCGLSLAYIYALKEDYNEAMKWVDQFISAVPALGWKAQGYWLKAFFCAWVGQWEEALRHCRTETELFEPTGNESGKALAILGEGWTYYAMGDVKSARKHIEEGIALASAYNPPRKNLELSIYCGVASVLLNLEEGRLASTEEREIGLAVIDSLLHESAQVDTTFFERVRNLSSLVRAAVWLAADSAEKAVSSVDERWPNGPALPHPVDMFFWHLPPDRDVLARCYEKTGAIDKAIAEYERLVTFNAQSTDRRLIHPVLHYRLAKLYEKKGRLADALAQYQKFVQICGGADKGMKEVTDAKERVAKLAGS